MFRWDEEKSRRNQAERGLPFDIAPAIFADDVIAWRDDRADCGELRINVLGRITGRIHFVTFTQRKSATWIISFRKANAREVNVYNKLFG